MPTFDWGPERRRAARVDLLAELEGYVVTLDETVRVRQLSAGGLTVETTSPLSPRFTHDFRLTLGERSATVRAQVKHSRVLVQGDSVSYIAGLAFESPSAEACHLIDSILDLAQGAVEPGERAWP
jgi:hypothetical protein